MSPEKLADILMTVPEFQPRALVLLREHQAVTGELFPSIPDRRERNRIFREMNQIHEDAISMGEALLKLEAVPLEHSNHSRIAGVFL